MVEVTSLKFTVKKRRKRPVCSWFPPAHILRINLRTPRAGPPEAGKFKRSALQGRVWREEEWLEVAADGFGVAGVEVGDEEEGDAEDDEGDEAVGALLAPDVEDDDFGDADEEEAETG